MAKLFHLRVTNRRSSLLLLFVIQTTLSFLVSPTQANEKVLESAIRDLNPQVLTGDDAQESSRMLANDVRRRIQEANLRESLEWKRVQTLPEWERFRDERVTALRRALGTFPPIPERLNFRVTGVIHGEGYVIEKLIYETRPGFWACGHIYRPASMPKEKPPGLMIVHSHHTPATQSELQALGIGWARVGCVVLVPELVGHGERREHPFRTEADYSQPFRPSRQDYYFRYNHGAQLHLLGDSLMGWFVWDLSRGLDVLLKHAQADPARIIVLGAVAGGGDPAGVLAAIDPRVTALVPYNFGGGQPDYATPEDTDRSFYWFGHASWESTRALAYGARDGFAHWLIVAAPAPKPLILAHEFAWQAERDPAWPRIEKVYSFYDAKNRLAATAGKGTVKGKAGPENTHCTHIGDFHRQQLDPFFKIWFNIPAPNNPSAKHSPEELACWTEELKKDLKPKGLLETASELFTQRVVTAVQKNQDLKSVKAAWSSRLGDIEPPTTPEVRECETEELGEALVHRFVVKPSPGIVVPGLLLRARPLKSSVRSPLVVIVSQSGKGALLKSRAAEIAALVNGGAAVCLVDVRGTGETRPADTSRGRNSPMTTLSALEWLLGQTLLGSQLKDLRAVLRYLRTRSDVDGSRVAIWGDSQALVNGPEARLAVPLDARLPEHAEPSGAILALLAALFEPDIVRAVHAHGGLVHYRSLMDKPFLYVPHESLVPGAAEAGDLPGIAAVLSTPLRLSGLVDGLNQTVPEGLIGRIYPNAQRSEESQHGWLLQRLFAR